MIKKLPALFNLISGSEVLILLLYVQSNCHSIPVTGYQDIVTINIYANK